MTAGNAIISLSLKNPWPWQRPCACVSAFYNGQWRRLAGQAQRMNRGRTSATIRQRTAKSRFSNVLQPRFVFESTPRSNRDVFRAGIGPEVHSGPIPARTFLVVYSIEVSINNPWVCITWFKTADMWPNGNIWLADGHVTSTKDEIVRKWMWNTPRARSVYGEYLLQRGGARALRGSS